MDESTPLSESAQHPDPGTASHPEPAWPGAGPLRRHPVRWTLTAAALAGVLTVGGYGVIQASTAPMSGASAGAATVRGGSGPTSGSAGTAAGPPGRGPGAGGPVSTGAARDTTGKVPPGGKPGGRRAEARAPSGR